MHPYTFAAFQDEFIKIADASGWTYPKDAPKQRVLIENTSAHPALRGPHNMVDASPMKLQESRVVPHEQFTQAHNLADTASTRRPTGTHPTATPGGTRIGKMVSKGTTYLAAHPGKALGIGAGVGAGVVGAGALALHAMRKHRDAASR